MKTAGFLERLKPLVGLKTKENSDVQGFAGEQALGDFRFTPLHFMMTGLGGIAISSVFAWLFYRSLIAVVLFSPLSVLIIRLEKRRQENKKKSELRSRFLDFLSSMEGAIEAGEAPEGALVSALRDLSLIYSAKDFMVQELTGMVRQLYMNRSVEDVITGFADRCRDEDIQRFAEVFSITKRSGGDLLRVIRSAERTLAEKEDVIREIKTVIASKRLEAGIMTVMPPGIIMYFLLVDRNFLTPLYTGIVGRALMSVMLLAYAGCVLLVLKITDIKV